jgi:hypothetical protein
MPPAPEPEPEPEVSAADEGIVAVALYEYVCFLGRYSTG